MNATRPAILTESAGPTASDLVAPDCRGLDFYRLDRGLRDLLPLYLDPAALAHFEPHFDRMGKLAGGRRDELAAAADKHTPGLHPRDRYGRAEGRVEYDPAARWREGQR